MISHIQIDFTLFRFVISVVITMIMFGGIFISIGRILNKQKSQCGKIKVLETSVWEKGQPLLQSVTNCKEKRNDLQTSCAQIIEKLEDMDEKRDVAVKEQNKQMQAITLHMQKIDLWYAESHKS